MKIFQCLNANSSANVYFNEYITIDFKIIEIGMI